MLRFDSADLDSLVSFATELASLGEASGREDLALLSQALSLRALERSVGAPLSEDESSLFFALAESIALHVEYPSPESADMIADLASDPRWMEPWLPLSAEERGALSLSCLEPEAAPLAPAISDSDSLPAEAFLEEPSEDPSEKASEEPGSCPMGERWLDPSAPSVPSFGMFEPSDPLPPILSGCEAIDFPEADLESLVAFAMEVSRIASTFERPEIKALSDALGLRALERSLGDPLDEGESALFAALADSARMLCDFPSSEPMEMIAELISAPGWRAPWFPLSPSERDALLSSIPGSEPSAPAESSFAEALSDLPAAEPSFADFAAASESGWESEPESGPESAFSAAEAAWVAHTLEGPAAIAAEASPGFMAFGPSEAPEAPSGGPQRIERSAHQILKDEAGHLFSSIEERSGALVAAEEQEMLAAFPELAEEISVVAGAAEAAGFTSLPWLIQDILSRFASVPAERGEILPGLARDLPAYLFDPTEASALALSQWASDPSLAFSALFPVEFWDLQADLSDFDVSEAEASLAIPQDVNSELLDGLLAEIPIQTAHLTEALRRVIARSGSRGDLELAKRAAHTLKGAANTVGVRGMASLTHRMEDVLLPLAERGFFPDESTGEALSRAADLLESMGEFLLGQGQAPEQVLEGLREISSLAAKVAIEGPESISGEPAPVAAAESEASSEAQVVPHVRIPAVLVDEMLRMVGESMTSSARLRNLVDFTQEEEIRSGLRADALQGLAIDLERQIDTLSRSEAVLASDTPEGFDDLEFERAGEIQTLIRRLLEMAADFRDAHSRSLDTLRTLRASVDGQARLHESHQEAVLRSRLAQVGSVVPRLQRGLRQVTRMVEKEARLVVSGESVLLDGHILQSLADALMHAIRNAVDHGLETKEARLAAGKPSEGLLRLSFSSEGGFVLARLSDDGAGFDTDRILAKARSMGLVAPDETPSTEEIHQLVFHSGFSTKDAVSQISGRGVGMDAVRAMVEAAQGTISIHSERGKGAVLLIRIPSTLLSMSVLLLRSGGKRFAISNRGVRDLKFFERGRITIQNGKRVIIDGSRAIPVVTLESLLGFPPAESEENASLIYIRDDRGHVTVIQAERIAEAQTLVVNKLSDFLPPIPGVVGSAISGDGYVSVILDLVALLEAAEGGSAPAASSSSARRDSGSGSRRSRRLPVLVADDSVSARRATVRVLVQAGWPVVEALDGLEAVRVLSKTPVCAIVTDMEMPRMSGIDLARHVRSQPALALLPMIMITSRSTEKHRKEAESAGIDAYLVKPFDEQALLERLQDLLAARSPAESSPSEPD